MKKLQIPAKHPEQNENDLRKPHPISKRRKRNRLIELVQNNQQMMKHKVSDPQNSLTFFANNTAASNQDNATQLHRTTRNKRINKDAILIEIETLKIDIKTGIVEINTFFESYYHDFPKNNLSHMQDVKNNFSCEYELITQHEVNNQLQLPALTKVRNRLMDLKERVIKYTNGLEHVYSVTVVLALDQEYRSLLQELLSFKGQKQEALITLKITNLLGMSLQALENLKSTYQEENESLREELSILKNITDQNELSVLENINDLIALTDKTYNWETDEEIFDSTNTLSL